MKRCIGIALNDDYTDICINSDQNQMTVPTAVCREKNSERWHVGEDAYKLALAGNGIVVDKLLSLLKKDGTETIGAVCYTAKQLLTLFFKELFSDEEKPDMVVVSIRKPERAVMEAVRDALAEAGIEQARIRVISHTESFVHFVLSQERELYSQMVGMFELSNQCLYYYEMKISRGGRKIVTAQAAPQEEAFNLDILKNPAGSKIADKILSALAERVMERRSYSSVFLCGKGFESVDFAPEFMSLICTRRRVCAETHMFAIGAALFAGSLAAGNTRSDYVIVCDTRSASDIGVRAVLNEKETVMPLIAAGDAWFDSVGRMEGILDGQNYVELVVMPVTQMKRMNVRLTLDGFPKRRNRTTRIQLTARFTAADKLQITVKDKGFGDLFPATDAFVSEELSLR